jgi:ferrous iron transport protein A
MQTLSVLKTGQTATIMAIHVDSAFRYRLNALGFKIGKPLSVLRTAPFNGPLHLRLGNTEVMIRKDDAAMIEVEV